jgi:hypothetical protein
MQGVFNAHGPGLYWLNLAIARRFTTAVAERREEIFWSLGVAAGRDLRKKTGDNSIELMVLQERIELSTSPLPKKSVRRFNDVLRRIGSTQIPLKMLA